MFRRFGDMTVNVRYIHIINKTDTKSVACNNQLTKNILLIPSSSAQTINQVVIAIIRLTFRIVQEGYAMMIRPFSDQTLILTIITALIMSHY